jgi:hypothetical protein
VSQSNLRSRLPLSWPTSWRVVQCPRREWSPRERRDIDEAQRASERERVSQSNLRSMLPLSWPTSWRVVQCPRRESNPHPHITPKDIRTYRNAELAAGKSSKTANNSAKIVSAGERHEKTRVHFGSPMTRFAPVSCSSPRFTKQDEAFISRSFQAGRFRFTFHIYTCEMRNKDQSNRQ